MAGDVCGFARRGHPTCRGMRVEWPVAAAHPRRRAAVLHRRRRRLSIRGPRSRAGRAEGPDREFCAAQQRRCGWTPTRPRAWPPPAARRCRHLSAERECRRPRRPVERGGPTPAGPASHSGGGGDARTGRLSAQPSGAMKSRGFSKPRAGTALRRVDGTRGHDVRAAAPPPSEWRGDEGLPTSLAPARSLVRTALKL